MNTDDDFAEQLRARVDAAAPHIPVDTSVVIPGARRRRTFTLAAAVAGSLAVVFGGWAGVSALPTLSEGVAPASEQTPTPTTTSSSDGTPCGTAFALEETDSPDIEIMGAVDVGTLDPETGSFEVGGGTGPGSTLWVEVGTTSDVPEGPWDDYHRSSVTTMLVDPDGTVAFWTDPERQLQGEATDGSGATWQDGLYDAVDCRTGRPLTGTYRAYATTTTDGTGGGETLELAPVSFELGAFQLAGQWPDRVPACGQPAPADLLAGEVDADFDVTLDPGVDLEDVRRGLHVDVTVTATGTDQLTGRVPQALHALLVDRDGMVVSRLYDPTRDEFDSGATFDVSQGESFSAEVYQWFSSCPDPDRYENVRAGTYDLYVYTVILASTCPDCGPAPRVAVGGPFPITLQ